MKQMELHAACISISAQERRQADVNNRKWHRCRLFANRDIQFPSRASYGQTSPKCTHGENPQTRHGPESESLSSYFFPAPLCTIDESNAPGMEFFLFQSAACASCSALLTSPKRTPEGDNRNTETERTPYQTRAGHQVWSASNTSMTFGY